MWEPKTKSILITFYETGEPEVFFNAGTDEETALLREWLESNLKCEQPAGLSGGVLTAPLVRGDDHDVGEVPPESENEKAGQV